MAIARTFCFLHLVHWILILCAWSFTYQLPDTYWDILNSHMSESQIALLAMISKLWSILLAIHTILGISCFNLGFLAGKKKGICEGGGPANNFPIFRIMYRLLRRSPSLASVLPSIAKDASSVSLDITMTAVTNPLSSRVKGDVALTSSKERNVSTSTGSSFSKSSPSSFAIKNGAAGLLASTSTPGGSSSITGTTLSASRPNSSTAPNNNGAFHDIVDTHVLSPINSESNKTSLSSAAITSLSAFDTMLINAGSHAIRDFPPEPESPSSQFFWTILRLSLSAFLLIPQIFVTFVLLVNLFLPLSSSIMPAMAFEQQYLSNLVQIKSKLQDGMLGSLIFQAIGCTWALIDITITFFIIGRMEGNN